MFSQEFESNKPLTTFANIEFKDGMISYIVNGNLVLLYPDLLPLVYNKNVLRISYNNEQTNVGSEYISNSRKAISSFVNSEVVDLMSNESQNDYLRLCALLTIWEKELSSHAITELKKLSVSNNDGLKENEELVRGLLDLYVKLKSEEE